MIKSKVRRIPKPQLILWNRRPKQSYFCQLHTPSAMYKLSLLLYYYYDVVFRPCVGIVCEPPEEEQWFCKRCEVTPTPTVTKSTGKKKTGGARGRGRKPGKRRWGYRTVRTLTVSETLNIGRKIIRLKAGLNDFFFFLALWNKLLN